MKHASRCIAAAAWALLLAGAAVAETAEQMISAADPARGLKVFKQCKACHTVEEGGRNLVGPNLWSIIGKDVASVEGYRYTKAMIEFGGVWTLERLYEYLADPRGAVPRSRMVFPGVRKDGDRAAVIAYLQTQSEQSDGE